MTEHHEPNMRAHEVAALADLAEDSVTKVVIEGTPVALAYLEGELYAVADTCSHADFSLSEGELHPIDCAIECPKHGALFSLRSGEALTLPATAPVQAYAVEVADGKVLVSVPDAENATNTADDNKGGQS